LLQAFSNRSAVVLLVESSGSTRQVMADVLKGCGFKTIQAVATIQDALAQLETEHVDWVITSLNADQPTNGLQIVNLLVETPFLHHVRCSLLLEEGESWCLDRAYSLGMLSHHTKPITKEVFGTEMSTLVAKMEAAGWRDAVVAGEYLREHLRKSGKPEKLLDFERTLVETYPGDAAVLVNLAKAQSAAGKQESARATLHQAKMLAPDLDQQITVTATELFGAEGLGQNTAPEAGAINLLGIENAVVIDSDDSVRAAVAEVLKELGVPGIHTFVDGESAWEWLKENPEPQVIVMEWRLLKISAPILMQRIRHQGHTSVPFIVLSSLLKPTDMPLVREIGISNIVSKPFERQALLKALVWTIQQERSPTELQTQELKIRKLLQTGKKSEAASAAAKFIANKATPIARKRYIEAELAFSADDFARCRDLGIEALRLSGDTILILNLLGKAFMRLSDFEAALKCFEKAQQMSPLNIERLCNIAEAQTELENETKAEEALQGATDIDPDSKQVEEAQIKKAVITGNLESARALMSQMESVSNVVGYMNNKAVALARCGKFDEGIQLYEKTVESIPENKLNIKPVVLYNMALAKVRGGDLDGAITILEQVLSAKTSRVHKKASSLLKKLKIASEKGTAVILAGDDNDGGDSQAKASASGSENIKVGETNTKDLHEYLLASVAPQRGDIGCYMIHNPAAEDVSKANELLKNMPRFQKRSAIERDESMGAERVAKTKAS
jgi:CheY-like chemotaxis protein